MITLKIKFESRYIYFVVKKNKQKNPNKICFKQNETEASSMSFEAQFLTYVL